MELSQLRYVQAIATAGNFTRAADKLNIAQPSLSQQILKLEREIGHRLFHRLGRKAVLTEAGAVFLERARKILSEVENVTKELSDSPSLERRITVGAIPTICPYLLPPLIERCNVKYPNLQIDVREDFRSDLLRAVLEGDVDMAIAATPITNPRLSVETLLTEPLLLVVARDHRLASKPDITAQDIADELFVMLGSSSSPRSPDPNLLRRPPVRASDRISVRPGANRKTLREPRLRGLDSAQSRPNGGRPTDTHVPRYPRRQSVSGTRHYPAPAALPKPGSGAIHRPSARVCGLNLNRLKSGTERWFGLLSDYR